MTTSAIFKGLFTYLRFYFSKIMTHPLKNNNRHSKFDLRRMFLVNNHYWIVKVELDADGFKIPTQVVLELDASPKPQEHILSISEILP